MKIWAGTVLIAASLLVQQQIFVPANDVSFAISTQRNSCGVRELIVVKYRITNVSNGPVYVPRGFHETHCLELGPHVWGGFENSEGRHFTPGYGSSCGSSPDAPRPTATERMHERRAAPSG